jgi:hypothetical protein
MYNPAEFLTINIYEEQSRIIVVVYEGKKHPHLTPYIDISSNDPL